jgi:hypothetical protein
MAGIWLIFPPNSINYIGSRIIDIVASIIVDILAASRYLLALVKRKE